MEQEVPDHGGDEGADAAPEEGALPAKIFEHRGTDEGEDGRLAPIPSHGVADREAAPVREPLGQLRKTVEGKLARMNPMLKPMDPATEILNGPSLPWSRPPTTKEIPSTIHS